MSGKGGGQEKTEKLLFGGHGAPASGLSGAARCLKLTLPLMSVSVVSSGMAPDPSQRDSHLPFPRSSNPGVFVPPGDLSDGTYHDSLCSHLDT